MALPALALSCLIASIGLSRMIVVSRQSGFWSVRDTTYFAQFADAHLCGKVAVYIGAHDHDREWMAPQCGMEILVSGGGGETSPLARPGDPEALFASADEGFLYARATATEIDGTFYDVDGKPSFHRTAEIAR